MIGLVIFLGAVVAIDLALHVIMARQLRAFAEVMSDRKPQESER